VGGSIDRGSELPWALPSLSSLGQEGWSSGFLLSTHGVLDWGFSQPTFLPSTTASMHGGSGIICMGWCFHTISGDPTGMLLASGFALNTNRCFALCGRIHSDFVSQRGSVASRVRRGHLGFLFPLTCQGHLSTTVVVWRGFSEHKSVN